LSFNGKSHEPAPRGPNRYGGVPAVAEGLPPHRGGSTGIQSIEVGSPLLQALTAAGGAMTLTGLATEARMTPSKAHKYLTSFVRVGLVYQSTETGRYNLGPLAVEIGFAALRRVSVAEFGQDALNELRDTLDLTASLTIWANHGPTIIRRAENRQPVSLVVQLGLVLPVLTSANGRIFAAFLDRSITGQQIRSELAPRDGAAAKAGLHGLAEVEKLLAEIRRHGVAVADGFVNMGVAAVSAPVFDHTNTLVAALTLVGARGVHDLSWRSPSAGILKGVAKTLSRRLGAVDAGGTGGGR
jgi:DNA-binding IclR family transcriptional regulator